MGNWKHHRMNTSAFVIPARHRHRPVTKRDVEQPPAILLPAMRPLCLARRQITRHPIPVVRCLDSSHKALPKDLSETETGTPWRPRSRPYAYGQYSTTVLECQQPQITRLGKELVKNS